MLLRSGYAYAVANELCKDSGLDIPGMYEYALLVVVTDTPIDRALAYLEDCGNPESARCRLLLRSAERCFREIGDTNGPEYEDRRT